MSLRANKTEPMPLNALSRHWTAHWARHLYLRIWLAVVLGVPLGVLRGQFEVPAARLWDLLFLMPFMVPPLVIVRRLPAFWSLSGQLRQMKQGVQPQHLSFDAFE